MTETKIYVGLNDPETGRQLFETEIHKHSERRLQKL